MSQERKKSLSVPISKRKNTNNMEYRHELKFEVSDMELKKIEYRIKPFLHKDAHQNGDYYLIRSLYFDDMYDSCLNENMAGTDKRHKYRIRTYDGSSSVIRLEKKSKEHNMTHKDSVEITEDECRLYMSGKAPQLATCKTDLEKELFVSAKTKCMFPKCIVEYERSAYVMNVGNVRVTFDRNIRGTLNVQDFFEDIIDAVPVMKSGMHILEVKFDEFLPQYLLEVLDVGSLRRQSFSKYASVRCVCG